MKPTSLKMTNIRTFADVAVNLTDVNAVTLTGENGAGKSTIVEGILRGLFSDGVSILPSNMVRLGEESGCIELEFDHSGQHYKIIRKGGKKSDLQFLLQTDDSEYIALSGANATETQAKIVSTLDMDEKLFLASSCVTQGNSSGICTAKPAERKALMYRIYEKELEKYQGLHDKAKAVAYGASLDIGSYGATLSRLSTVIETKSGIEAELQLGRQNLAENQLALENYKTELKTAEQQLACVTEAEAKYADLVRQVGSLNSEIERLEREGTAYEEKIRQADAVLAKRDVIDQAAKRQAELKPLIADMVEKSAKVAEINQQISVKKLECSKEIEEFYATKTAEIDAEKATWMDLSQQLNKVNSDIQYHEKELVRLQSSSLLLSQVPCGDSFPGCKLIAGAVAAKNDLPKHQSAAQQLVTRIDILRDEVELSEVKGKRLTAERTNLKTATEAKYAETIRALAASVIEVGYDRPEHDALVREAEQLEQSTQLRHRMSAAEAVKRESAESLANLNARIAEKQAEVDKLQSQTFELSTEFSDKALFNDRKRNALSNIEQVENQIRLRERSIGGYEANLAAIAQAEQEHAEVTEAVKAAEERHQVFLTLQQAFSRDGIPALIIDALIPQIEEYGNALLNKLSNGRMNLRFTTQKRTGNGIAETLDILISDQSGERAYEDFSGGEQLRVNLAVRIAIGQILAQRSGATIRTLLLDEVCSPLDEAGEDALIESITQLQAMFDLIVLITHRESLKDRLPSQIIVTKNGGGSKAVLVG